MGCSEYNLEKTHKEAHNKLLHLLLGQEIIEINLIPPVSDLVIHFADGLVMELFSDSNIYESWTLSDGNGFELISATAGELLSQNI